MAEADFNLSSVSSLFRTDGRSVAVRHAGIAIAVTLAFLAFHAARGFPTLTDSKGDNDSLLRLVQVRDLLAGQSWFDLNQYRMGLEGGFEMHWSRLIDLPIAVLILTVGETAALVIWPMLLFALSLFLIIRATHLIGGDAAILPAAVTGGLALLFVNVFVPGALDHHNAQLALALGTIYAMMTALQAGSRSAASGGAAAAICAALMVAIGMEAAPYAAAACAVAAGGFLAGGTRNVTVARWFGLAFAGTAALCLATTVPPQNWFLVACDAMSLPQTTLAVLGGGGLALATFIPSLSRTFAMRFSALVGLGLFATFVAVSAFPQCLGDPYADLDPLLRRYWLSSVTEAQSLSALIDARGYSTIAGYYATPLLALVALAVAALRRGFTAPVLVLAVFLTLAVAVSCWQVRGGVFSVAFAAIVLAAWIGRLRIAALDQRSLWAQLPMAAVWLLSVSLLWQAVGAAVEPRAADLARNSDLAEPQQQSWCYSLSDLAELAQLPAGTVLTISNLGSIVLRQTGHRVLNGPYHRNNDGNRAALDLLMAPPADEGRGARARGIDYVAFCPGNPETVALAHWAPTGLAAVMLDGSIPDWLEPLTGSETSPLQIFRVSP